MSRRSISRFVPWCAGLAALLPACAATVPPPELTAARAAFARAEAGPAPQISPVDVHEARLALDTAERAYLDDADGKRTRDLAYVAERKAELAEVRAGIAVALSSQQRAESERDARRAEELRAAQGRLADARGRLSSTRESAASAEQALEEERRAHAAAEKKAQDALDRLAVAAALAVKQEPRGTVITIPEGVLFAFGKYELLPAAAQKLDQVAEALKGQEAHEIVVEGHTDSVGTDAFNQDLSERRAQAVRDYLVSRGVPADRVKAAGLGETHPVADNGSAEGRAQNRRVEIIVKAVERR